MDDHSPVSRGEYSRALDGLHRRINDVERELEKRIDDGDRAVARHAKGNYSAADAELKLQLDSVRETMFGGRGTKGIIVQLTELSTTQASTEPILRDLKQSVDSLRLEMAKGKKSSDSGERKAVATWAATPGGQKLLLAGAALLLAVAAAIGGYQLAPDAPSRERQERPERPHRRAPEPPAPPAPDLPPTR